jgi:hypothetical protein
MAMCRRKYLEVLNGYRDGIMTNILLIVSGNQDVEPLIQELAERCMDLDPVLIRFKKTMEVRPDPQDILDYLFLEISDIKAAETFVQSLNYEGRQLNVPKEKLSKFIGIWKLFRQVLANNLAAGRNNSKKYYAGLFKLFLVKLMK